ncbi:hypothetical protein OIU84_012146 [Salix udensis]|uniref:Uncharacterized protein n=1 Tax=Salix udensis TaxID=889485 RepID=A0AAD6NSY0_9ROSI|nr:hypothetical protein OIU84_012146 [Salix udensis]
MKSLDVEGAGENYANTDTHEGASKAEDQEGQNMERKVLARARIISSRNEPATPLMIFLVLELIEPGRLCSIWIDKVVYSRAYLVMGVITVCDLRDDKMARHA